jgi:hypothetical protein
MYIGSTGPRGLHHLVYQMRYYASVPAFLTRSALCLIWSLFWLVYHRFMKSWIMLWMKLKRAMLRRLM